MKILAWPAAIAVGGVATLLFGLSMLAASHTEDRALTALHPSALLMDAEMRAATASLPQVAPKIPCSADIHLTASGTSENRFTIMTDAAMMREARCLHRHGLLSRSDLASILGAKPTPARRGLSGVVPLSLQIVPSTVLVTIWSVLLALDLLAALLFVRYWRKPRLRVSISG